MCNISQDMFWVFNQKLLRNVCNRGFANVYRTIRFYKSMVDFLLLFVQLQV